MLCIHIQAQYKGMLAPVFGRVMVINTSELVGTRQQLIIPVTKQNGEHAISIR